MGLLYTIPANLAWIWNYFKVTIYRLLSTYRLWTWKIGESSCLCHDRQHLCLPSVEGSLSLFHSISVFSSQPRHPEELVCHSLQLSHFITSSPAGQQTPQDVSTLTDTVREAGKEPGNRGSRPLPLLYHWVAEAKTTETKRQRETALTLRSTNLAHRLN